MYITITNALIARITEIYKKFKCDEEVIEEIDTSDVLDIEIPDDFEEYDSDQ